MASLNHDIERYLRGELTPAERHALEQQALLDPFLAEALEGAEQARPEDFSADIRIINESLKKKAKVSRRFLDINGWQWYSGIAAGLALLALSTYTVIMMIGEQKKKAQIAMNEQTVVADSIGANVSPQKEDSPSSTIAEEQKDEKPVSGVQPEKRKQPDAITSEKKTTSKPNAQGSTVASQGESGRMLLDSTIVHPQAEVADLAKEPVLESRDAVVNVDDEEAKAATLAAKQETETRDKKSRFRSAEKAETASPSAGLFNISKETLIRGKVTSNGEGLPGINILVKGTSIGTVTNAEGEYMIAVPEGKDALTFNFIGLQAEEVPIGQAVEGHIDVEMQEDLTQLSEVVVTGKSGANPDRTFATMMMAMPRGGRRAFKKYLEDNVRYPQQALDNNVKGKVIVQFTVDASGKLTDFKIVRGIGYGCDEEVIRAIQNGPDWQPTKKDDTAVTEEVKVKYKFDKQ
jgi:TonB family protein